jgi:hypothetical protein
LILKLLPRRLYTVLTLLTLIIVIAADASRLWLVDTVIVGGALILIFYRSEAGAVA